MGPGFCGRNTTPNKKARRDVFGLARANRSLLHCRDRHRIARLAALDRGDGLTRQDSMRPTLPLCVRSGMSLCRPVRAHYAGYTNPRVPTQMAHPGRLMGFVGRLLGLSCGRTIGCSDKVTDAVDLESLWRPTPFRTVTARVSAR